MGRHIDPLSRCIEELDWQQTSIGAISLRWRYDPFLKAEVYEIKLAPCQGRPPITATFKLSTPRGRATLRQIPMAAWATNHPSFVHCPSETTSTEPSTTLMAVCSSMA
jgi:hypothetical protein